MLHTTPGMASITRHGLNNNIKGKTLGITDVSATGGCTEIIPRCSMRPGKTPLYACPGTSTPHGAVRICQFLHVDGYSVGHVSGKSVKTCNLMTFMTFVKDS